MPDPFGVYLPFPLSTLAYHIKNAKIRGGTQMKKTISAISVLLFLIYAFVPLFSVIAWIAGYSFTLYSYTISAIVNVIFSIIACIIVFTYQGSATGHVGRIFTVKEVIPFSGKVLKKLSMQYPSANITVRNFPITTEELRKKSKIKDGGNIYIFATTLYPDKKIFIICEKIINA